MSAAIHRVRLHARMVVVLIAVSMFTGSELIWSWAAVGLGHTLVMLLALTEVGE